MSILSRDSTYRNRRVSKSSGVGEVMKRQDDDWYGTPILEDNGWQLLSGNDGAGGLYYYVYHGCGKDHWWHTIGEQSTKGWRCASCDTPVPERMKGFITLIEWEK